MGFYTKCTKVIVCFNSHVTSDYGFIPQDQDWCLIIYLPAGKHIKYYMKKNVKATALKTKYSVPESIRRALYFWVTFYWTEGNISHCWCTVDKQHIDCINIEPIWDGMVSLCQLCGLAPAVGGGASAITWRPSICHKQVLWLQPAQKVSKPLIWKNKKHAMIFTNWTRWGE